MIDTVTRHETDAVYHTEALLTPQGLRYACTVLAPKQAQHIDNIGSGWCLTPEAAEAQARRLYAIALSVEQMQAGRMERAA